MGDTLPKLLARLGIDTSEFDSGVDSAVSKANSAGLNMANGLAKVGGAIVLGGIAVAGAGIVGLGSILSKASAEAMEAEDSLAKVNAIITSTGGIAGVTEKAITDYADKMQFLTGIQDDTILAGQAMLLTFTNIGSNVFPMASDAVLNMSKMFGSVDAAALQVGKALNDPIAGATALRRVGVKLTDQQEEQIKSLVALGDLEGAQKVILNELNTEFGGVAVAMGKTTEGQKAILKNRIDDMLENLGNKLLPVINQGIQVLSDLLADPIVETAITAIGDAVVGLATDVLDNVPNVIQNFKNFVDFLKNNQPVVIGVLVALGVAIGVWAVQTAIAGWTAMAPFAPIILILLGIAAAVALFVEAWNTNFLGIRDTTIEVWTNSIQPALQEMGDWLATNIPVAAQATKDYFETNLLPGLIAYAQAVGQFLLPVLQVVVSFFQVVLPAAIGVMVSIWNNVLQPAFMTIWKIISQYVWPVLKAVGTVIYEVLVTAFTIIAGIIQNFVWPALKWLYDLLAEKVFPIFKTVGEWISEKLSPAFKTLGEWVQKLVGFFTTLGEKIAALRDKLPDWLTPGSPTPLEIGIVGVDRALSGLSSAALPKFRTQLNLLPTIPDIDALSVDSRVASASTSDQGSNEEAMISEIRDMFERMPSMLSLAMKEALQGREF